jgi:hypothetical protein
VDCDVKTKAGFGRHRERNDVVQLKLMSHVVEIAGLNRLEPNKVTFRRFPIKAGLPT